MNTDLLIIEYAYWTKKNRSSQSRRNNPFPLQYATMMTRGWAFLGISRHQHDLDIQRYITEANIWLTNR